MSRLILLLVLGTIGFSISFSTIQVFSQNESVPPSIQNLSQQNDSLRIEIMDLQKKTESIEVQNRLIVKAMEVQLNEAESKARFLEIALTVLGGFLGIIIAIITFGRLWQERWERKQDKWEQEKQARQENRENKIMDTLNKNVSTVTSLMNIIAEGQKVAKEVREVAEHQQLQSQPFLQEIVTINQAAEKLLKEGKLKRRMVRKREVQGKIHQIGNRVEKILMLLPLITGEDRLSPLALYVKALQEFLDSNYKYANDLFKEVRHLEPKGDLLWQVPFYEGIMAQNIGDYASAFQSFQEAIIERKVADPELGSHTEIAENTFFKFSQDTNKNQRSIGMNETRKRCLEIIQRAEGIKTESDINLANIKVGENPNRTDEYARLQARCFLIAGNSYWIEEDFSNARIMYERALEIEEARLTEQPSIYVFSSIGQVLDKLNNLGETTTDPLPFYEKAYYGLQARLGRFEEAQNRILKTALFARCLKRLKEANKIENTWQPVQFRIQTERVIEDELRFKNPDLKLFSPFSKLHLSQTEFIEEIWKEIPQDG